MPLALLYAGIELHHHGSLHGREVRLTVEPHSRVGRDPAADGTYPPLRTPDAEIQAWHLRSAGSANALSGDGRLSEESPDTDPPDRYRYDPEDPAPTYGGPVYWGMNRVGPVEQRSILGRQDVLYYRSDRLPKAQAVVGEVNLDLWVASEAEDTDIIAKLCVVEPNGRVTCLTVGSPQIAVHQILHDRGHPSRLLLPVVEL